MERCAATAFQLQTGSHFVPSMSAEDCTAHQNSTVSSRGVLARASEGLVVAKRRSEDGCDAEVTSTD
jgi:hypothetical protein